MNEKLYQLKQEFLDTWPIEKLEQMTLEEYTNLDKTSFCYWVEAITTDLGSVWGGSAYKFGIFKRRALLSENYNEKRRTDGVYAWYGKYGDTKEEVFENIKSIVLNIAKSVQSNNLEAIDKIDLGNGLKWKIAFLYGDFNSLNAFKLDALRVIATNLGIEYTNKTPISEFHKEIIKTKTDDAEYFSWSHGLWEQYQARLRDVKKEFAKWLNENTFESYRAYLGYTNKSIEDRLDEINEFFDDLDFFSVDPTNVNGLVSSILFLLSKKERFKNSEFVEYDSKNSNGIPKAILGKNYYIKFLKEKFDYQEPNYWIFQGNPNIYNITNALVAGHLKSWKVASHKDKIQIGDQVIIWQTGNEAGCYALAEVISEVGIFKDEDVEQQYYVKLEDDLATERVKIKITKNLADDPILWRDLKNNPGFSNFKAGNQGTNFSATKEEFNALIEWSNSFEETRARLDPAIFHEYIAFVRSIVKALDLKPNDPRVVYSLRNDRLNFIVGQKYCANVFVSGSKGKFGVIATNKLSKNSEDFAGENPKTYYSYIDTLDLNDNEIKLVRDAISSLLDKTTKSSYSKSNNLDFQNFVYGISTNPKKENNMDTPINQILYGPPGTGKTYYLKDQLFDKYTLKETSITKEQHFETVVSGCSWWQVIAIALLDLKKAKVSDIHNNKWVQKKASLSNSKTIRPTLWGQLQSHTINECEFVNVADRQQPLIFSKTKDSHWEISEELVTELVPELYDLKDSVDNYNPDPDKVIKHYDFVTFHQSFAYEDFIEGIKPILPETDTEEAKDLGFKIEDGVFKLICTKAKNDPENRYAIFIDEINRGNVSAIFGELITLIEIDKRQGAKNELSIKLPYSKKEFSVPSNLDIYGTMNTADRSVEALDTALRRRFDFIEMMPDHSVIQEESVGAIKLSEVLKIINQRIELLRDRDHTIGHSYFVGVNTEDKLANAFNNKIVPLLQEYFYGDYGKIGLVLGSGFVEKLKNHNIDFASFDYENANDYKTISYHLILVNEDTVINAVEILLGKKETILE